MSKVTDVKRTAKPSMITIGGKERELRFDMNAFAELENRFGSIDKAMASLTDGKIGQIRVLIWAGLIHGEVDGFDAMGEPLGYKITPYEVGSWLETPAEMTEVAKILGTAMGSSMPAPEDLPEDIKEKLEAAGIDFDASEEQGKNVKNTQVTAPKAPRARVKAKA